MIYDFTKDGSLLIVTLDIEGGTMYKTATGELRIVV